MAVTYVQLVNELLRRINEVALDTSGSGFSSVKGVQALAKDAINNSVREILQYNQEWPFSLTVYTETLVTGTGSYSFQSDFSRVDWDSFYLKKLTSADNAPGKLPVITYTDYLRSYRAGDETAGTGGYATPSAIYMTQDSKFGVTPPPDAAYEIEYSYFSFPADMTMWNDTTLIPDRFRYVLIDGAMMYMMRFRSNDQQGEIHRVKFEKGIDDMRRLLLDEHRSVTSTVVHRGAIGSQIFKDIN